MNLTESIMRMALERLDSKLTCPVRLIIGVLPPDYGSRLVPVCQFQFLEVLALSKEDLLIMKCFAGRQKDVVHIKALLKQKVQKEIVEDHLSKLLQKRIPGAQNAIDFYDDVRDQME